MFKNRWQYGDCENMIEVVCEKLTPILYGKYNVCEYYNSKNYFI